MKRPQDEQTATPMERLASFTKKLIAVPKEEIDKRTREYEVRKRERRKKRVKP
jgi:hypothetical protein